jgi:quinol monooxygenase YgiN
MAAKSFTAMSSIIATITARKGEGKALEEILRKLVQATAREDGARVYDLTRPENTTDVFVVMERYHDSAARDRHLSSEHLRRVLEEASAVLACDLDVKLLDPVEGIRQQAKQVEGISAEVSELPLGPVSLVYARSERGLLACGALDPAALEKFGLVVARVRPAAGASIGNLEDLLAGQVREANAHAQAKGVKVGQSGKEAWQLMHG